MIGHEMIVEDLAATRSGRHAVILCHPDPASFNHGLAEAYCKVVRAAGQQVVLRDLYALNFDPVLKADERPTIQNPVQSADVAAVRGSFVGTRKDMAEALAFAAEGKVKADIELQPLSAINDVLGRLEHGPVPSRVVIDFGSRA
jgi:propanol-preferring alcohol dehydrogenase